MVRLQHEGVYAAAFVAISAPALMVHGTLDPHPGRLIYKSPYLPQLQWHSNHHPWIDTGLRRFFRFFSLIREWLGQRMGTASG